MSWKSNPAFHEVEFILNTIILSSIKSHSIVYLANICYTFLLNMQEKLVSEFRKAGSAHIYVPKEIIFGAGSPANEVAYLVTGRVLGYEIRQSQKRPERVAAATFRVSYPGSILGSDEDLERDCYAHNTRALELCETIMVPRDRFQEMTQQNPDLSLYLIEQVIRKQRFSNQGVGWLNFLNSGRLDSSKRLAKALLVLDEQDQAHGFNYPEHEKTINLMSQTEIGGLISISREHAYRALTALENQRILISSHC